MLMYAFLTKKDYQIWDLQKELQSLTPKVKALTFSKTSTPYVVYVHTKEELTENEIDAIRQVL